MAIHLFSQPHYLSECITLLSNHANEETYEALILEMTKNHSIPEQDISPLFQDQILMRDRVLAELQQEFHNLAHYFKRIGDNKNGSVCLASLIFAPSTHTDVNVYAQQLLSLSEESRRKHIVQSVIGDFLDSTVADEDVEALHSPNMLERYILENATTDAEKVALLSLCCKFADSVCDLTPLLSKAIILFKENESLILPSFTAHREKLQERIALGRPNVLDRYIKLPKIETDGGPFYIIPSVMAANSAQYIGRNDENGNVNQQFIFYGVNLDALEDMRSHQEGHKKSTADILKVLGDKTKQDILYALRHEELYGQELAEKLGLSTATISYHMSLLLNLGFVYVKRENTRLYYSLNKHVLANSVDQVRAHFCE